MSYIKIDIGGRERGLKFSQGTNILLQDKLIDMDESERKAFGVQYIIWAGLKTNCAIKGERLTNADETPVTIEDVFDWVEKLSAEVILGIVNLYTEVNAAVPKPTETDTDEKKNITTPPSVTESDAGS